METVGTLQQIVINLLGKAVLKTLNGREYLVAPATSIVPGVLEGSEGALFYPHKEIARNYKDWDDTAITNHHPVDKGVPSSAKIRKVLEKHGIGIIKNTKIGDGGRLQHELWFDVEYTKAADKRFGTQIYNRLLAGDPIELSTGLYTQNQPWSGRYGNKQYTHIARNYRPDHLAILDRQTGACSLQDGCGVLVNELGGDVVLDEKARKSILRRIGEALGILNAARTCPKCGMEMNGKECSGCDYVENDCSGMGSKPAQNALPASSPNLVGRYGNPTDAETGRYLPRGAGFGKGDVHKAAKAGSQHSSGHEQNPPTDTDGDTVHDLALIGQGDRDPEIMTEKAPDTLKSIDVKPTANQETDMTREQMLSRLTANCSCEGDKAAFNSLSDEMLKTLMTKDTAAIALNQIAKDHAIPSTLSINEMPEALKKAQEAKMAKKEGEEEEEEKEVTENKKGKKTAQAPARMTYDEWSKIAPPEVVERDQLAQNLLKREKENLVLRLVSNIGDPGKKKQLYDKYMLRPLSDLNEMIEMLPPARNQQFQEQDFGGGFPNPYPLSQSPHTPINNDAQFFVGGLANNGAGATPPQLQILNTEDGDQGLEMLSVNWAEESQLKERHYRQEEAAAVAKRKSAG